MKLSIISEIHVLTSDVKLSLLDGYVLVGVVGNGEIERTVPCRLSVSYWHVVVSHPGVYQSNR